MGVHEDTVHLLARQKILEGTYKDTIGLLKINKSDIAWMMESIEEYIRPCWGVIKALLAYILSKTIIVETYGDYLSYANPDNEMIARMLHLPTNKNKLLLEKDAQTVQVQTAEYKIHNRTVYDIMDQLCKDTHLYPCVK